jgi:hypothetical protein
MAKGTILPTMGMQMVELILGIAVIVVILGVVMMLTMSSQAPSSVYT